MRINQKRENKLSRKRWKKQKENRNSKENSFIELKFPAKSCQKIAGIRKRKKSINKTKKIIQSLKGKVDQLEKQKNLLSKKLKIKTKLLNQITEEKSIKNVKSCIQIINNISDKITSTKSHKEKQ